MNSILDRYLNIIRKALPQKVIRPSVGLDIGVDTCKAVELILENDSYKVLNWAVEPTDKIDVTNTIKKIFSKIPAQPNTISTAVSGHGTLMRYVDMPRMSLEDLRNSVLLEADKHFPFDKSNIYTDCYILNNESKGSTMPVLIAAAKKEIVDKRLQLFSNLGVSIDFIGLNILALGNVFKVAHYKKQKHESAASGGIDNQSKSQTLAVLDIGDMTTSLIILNDNTPKFSRDMFVGGRDLTKRISNVFGIEHSEAAAIKRNPQDKLENVLSSCDSILMNLISEIRLSFDYFVTEHNLSISKLLLTGGSSRLSGIEDFFKRNLDVTVETWDPLDVFTGIAQDDEIRKHSNRLGVALGLALYRYD